MPKSKNQQSPSHFVAAITFIFLCMKRSWSNAYTKKKKEKGMTLVPVDKTALKVHPQQECRTKTFSHPCLKTHGSNACSPLSLITFNYY